MSKQGVNRFPQLINVPLKNHTKSVVILSAIIEQLCSCHYMTRYHKKRLLTKGIRLTKADSMEPKSTLVDYFKKTFQIFCHTYFFLRQPICGFIEHSSILSSTFAAYLVLSWIKYCSRIFQSKSNFRNIIRMIREIRTKNTLNLSTHFQLLCTVNTH